MYFFYIIVLFAYYHGTAAHPIIPGNASPSRYPRWPLHPNSPFHTSALHSPTDASHQADSERDHWNGQASANADRNLWDSPTDSLHRTAFDQSNWEGPTDSKHETDLDENSFNSRIADVFFDEQIRGHSEYTLGFSKTLIFETLKSFCNKRFYIPDEMDYEGLIKFAIENLGINDKKRVLYQIFKEAYGYRDSQPLPWTEINSYVLGNDKISLKEMRVQQLDNLFTRLDKVQYDPQIGQSLFRNHKLVSTGPTDPQDYNSPFNSPTDSLHQNTFDEDDWDHQIDSTLRNYADGDYSHSSRDSSRQTLFDDSNSNGPAHSFYRDDSGGAPWDSQLGNHRANFNGNPRDSTADSSHLTNFDSTQRNGQIYSQRDRDPWHSPIYSLPASNIYKNHWIRPIPLPLIAKQIKGSYRTPYLSFSKSLIVETVRRYCIDKFFIPPDMEYSELIKAAIEELTRFDKTQILFQIFRISFGKNDRQLLPWTDINEFIEDSTEFISLKNPSIEQVDNILTKLDRIRFSMQINSRFSNHKLVFTEHWTEEQEDELNDFLNPPYLAHHDSSSSPVSRITKLLISDTIRSSFPNLRWQEVDYSEAIMARLADSLSFQQKLELISKILQRFIPQITNPLQNWIYIRNNMVENHLFLPYENLSRMTDSMLNTLLVHLHEIGFSPQVFNLESSNADKRGKNGIGERVDVNAPKKRRVA